jgi:hypothetical protein
MFYQWFILKNLKMKIFLSLLMLSTILVSCKKPVAAKDEPIYESSFTGNWVLQNITAPVAGDTLYFRIDTRSNLLRFKNYGAQTPGPVFIEVIYKYENNQFFYDDYVNPSAGFFNVTSYRWIIPGEQFKVRINEIIRSVSSDYYVIYAKVK